MIEKDYNKVVSVIQSCLTEQHLIASDRLINIFIDKWKDDPNAVVYAAKLGSIYRTKRKLHLHEQGIKN